MRPDPRTIDFAAVGVPEPIAADLRGRSYPDEWQRYWWIYLATVTSFLIVVMGAAMEITFAAFADLEAVRTEHALFYTGGVGPGSIAIVFAGLVAGAWIASCADRLFPAELREYLTVRSFDMTLRAKSGSSLLTCWLYRRAAAGITTTVTAEFIEQHAAVLRRWFGITALVLGVAAGLGVARDAATYDLGGEAAIERHSMFGTELVGYDAVDAVEVGCRRSGRYTTAVYDLVLRDGDRLDAFPRGRCGAQQIRRLEELDARLRDGGARFRAAAPDVDGRCAEDIARCASVPLDDVRAFLRP